MHDLEFCAVQPFVTRSLNIVMFTVVQENPGNNKDLEDLPVLHEGQVVFLGTTLSQKMPGSVFNFSIYLSVILPANFL